MTYKKIVEGYVKSKVGFYVEKLCKQFNIPAYFIERETVTFDTTYRKDCFLFECEVKIFADSHDYFRDNYKTIFVGGSVDDYSCLVSCIRTEDSKYIWYDVEETREKMGITEFKI